MGTSGTRIGREQSLFREINERIQKIAADESTYCLCECPDLDCMETFEVPLSEYEQVRHVPTHFLVRPGHVIDEVERVVASAADYVVVEKVGAAGFAVVAADVSRRPEEDASPAR